MSIDRIKYILVTLIILSVFLFEIQTKVLFFSRLSMVEPLVAILFIINLKYGKLNARFLVISLIFFYFSISIFYTSNETLDKMVSNYQVLFRIITLYVVVETMKTLAMNRMYFENMIRVMNILVIFVLTLFFLDVINIYSYQLNSGRFLSQNLQQSTGFYSEPALISQFLVLVISVLTLKMLTINVVKNSDIFRILLAILSLLFTSSLGGIVGILIIFMSFFVKFISVRFLVMIGIFLLLAVMILLGTENRVLSMINYLASNPSGIDGSYEVRIVKEFMVLGKYINSLSMEKFLFGISMPIIDFRNEGFFLYTGNIVGNGFVELLIRFGFIGFFMFIFLLYVYSKSFSNFVIVLCFSAVTMQIDGAIGKPMSLLWISIFIAYFNFYNVTLLKRRASE
jgi:hypothetical protein